MHKNGEKTLISEISFWIRNLRKKKNIYIYGKKEKIKYTIGKTNMMNKWLHDERHFISIGYFKIDNLHLVRLAKRNKYDKVTRDKKNAQRTIYRFCRKGDKAFNKYLRLMKKFYDDRTQKENELCMYAKIERDVKKLFFSGFI